MIRLNKDGHDESQYLPEKVLNPKTGLWEKFPIVNAFRARHGNVRYEGEAIKALTWLPDILNATLDEDGSELLTLDHLHICESIYNIVMTTKAALGISDIRTATMGMEGELKSLQLDKFTALIKNLLPYQSNLCFWLVCDEYNHGNVPLAKKMISSIWSSLEQAKKVIDDCNRSDNIPIGAAL